jgi:peptidyl-tRNA hydrolase, PTH2 family
MPTEPNPFDDKKLAQIRADQSDPIVQYYIVREDVPMSVGKVCAQIAHGAQMFLFGYFELKSKSTAIPWGGAPMLKVEITDKWRAGSFRKVVLKGDTKEFEKIKEELDVFVVRDAGLTEIDPGTETVLVTWPMLKSKQPKVLARLQVLVVVNDPIDLKHSRDIVVTECVSCGALTLNAESDYCACGHELYPVSKTYHPGSRVTALLSHMIPKD